MDLTNEFKQKLIEANKICAATYGNGTIEFVKASKELVAQIIEINELKQEVKKLKEESVKTNELLTNILSINTKMYEALNKTNATTPATKK